MPHIKLPDGLPGIRSLFSFRPGTSGPLLELAEVLLRSPSSLSRGERELIASYVSHLNACQYCTRSHSAYAAASLEGGSVLVEQVKADPEAAPIEEKLKALLRIAGQVQRGGLCVSSSDISRATAAGATDVEIHDTVLIAAAFCMYNRYVDGLATLAPPEGAEVYAENAKRLLRDGYLGIPG